MQLNISSFRGGFDSAAHKDWYVASLIIDKEAPVSTSISKS